MEIKLFHDIERGVKSALTKKRIVNYYMYNYMYNHFSTIPDLAKELDLSVPTVTKFVTEMCEEGYIITHGKMETSEGRPPTLYGLNPEAGYFIGVDIKKFGLSMGVMNFVGELMENPVSVNCSLPNSPEGLNLFCEHVSRFISSVSVDKNKIVNIGVNISGRVNPESGYSFSLFNFEERPLAEILSERLGFPVSIDNDTRAMTYGEMMEGVVKGEKNFIFINLNWGLGAGIIIDGKMYLGKSGFSGELGHFNVFDNEIICHCGKRGCLETEVSGAAFHRILIENVKEGKRSILSEQILKDEKSLTLEDIVAATNKEDLLCIEILEEIAQKLGRYLAGVINLLNPEMVIIGGVLAQTGDYLLQPVRSAVRKYSQNMVNKDSVIVLSKLLDKAGVVGACMLARYNKFER